VLINEQLGSSACEVALPDKFVPVLGLWCCPLFARVSVANYFSTTYRCDLRPAATSAANCFDWPRGTLSESHFPVALTVKCFAKKRICPM